MTKRWVVVVDEQVIPPAGVFQGINVGWLGINLFMECPRLLSNVGPFPSSLTLGPTLTASGHSFNTRLSIRCPMIDGRYVFNRSLCAPIINHRSTSNVKESLVL